MRPPGVGGNIYVHCRYPRLARSRLMVRAATALEVTVAQAELLMQGMVKQALNELTDLYSV